MTVQVDIDNCDREPIHIPGAVQPHGVLVTLVGPELRVREASDNAPALLRVALDRLFGMPLHQLLDASSAELIGSNRNVRSWKRLNPIPATVSGRRFDAIVHRTGDALVLELEPTDLVSQGNLREYGADTHQALLNLQGAESLADLLQTAAEVVRWVTGYDRVMVYRFNEEGHGEVVAEEREPSLEPFLGLRYPASDIPAQARRLYVLNGLRIIADVDYRRAEIVRDARVPDPGALDLTWSTLRSVSPIHVEYLRNMGVGASMSVSLVLDGELWGLIACHHYSPKFVPYSVRMTCELLGQMLSTLIHAWQRTDEAALGEAIADRRMRLLERLHRADYIAAGLCEVPEDLLALVGASGAAVLEDGRLTTTGSCPPEGSLRAFVKWMAAENRELLATACTAREFPDAPSLGANGAGVLALGLPETEKNAVLWLRPAVEQTVAWGGNPQKTYAEGPNGPRLTPRGSFALWKETVENQSERWSRLEIEAARSLRAALLDVTVRKGREAEQSRDMLLGMVSHDLRNPLGAISFAAELLGMDGVEPSHVTRASARIAASSDRMRRMIEQLLDYTRVRAGSFELNAQRIDLVMLCRQLVEEIEGAHPGTRVELEVPNACTVMCDPDRMAQAISNLLGNARHHGDPARPMRLTLRCLPDRIEIEVRNEGPPIPADRLPTIFEPFHRAGQDARSRKHSGLGLGLFIVRRIVELHRGTIDIDSSPQGTVCTMRFPVRG